MDQAGLVAITPAAVAVSPSAAEVRRRFRGLEALAATAGRGVRGDHDLNPGMAPPERLREAAVLVALVDRPGGLTVIFTRRTAHLAAHAGQISFPGGHTEDGDESPEAAALRETEEEIGLDRRHIEPLGRLDTYITRTGFRVTPVVALVRPPFALTPDAREVDEVFEAPLSLILAPDQPRRESRELFGVARFFYVFPWQGHSIWGATAGMLVNLRQALEGKP
ncbi:MAG: CoA pyrophosphatase [Rhodospirillaceae bacterium]